MQPELLRPTRRTLLRSGVRASVAGLGAALSSTALVARARASGVQWPTLILIKLDGGNDGLNTVIPYTDPLYFRYRPTIALSGSKIVPLNSEYAFNSLLAPLISGSGSAWQSGEMAVLMGVGFADLIGGGSHFTASDIWGTAVPSIDTPQAGWFTRLLNHLSAQDRPAGAAADAVLTGRFPMEAVGGPGIRAMVAPPPGKRIGISSQNPNVAARVAANPTYAWMAREQAAVNAMAKPFATADSIQLSAHFPSSDLGAQMAEAAKLVASGMGVPVISVNQATYDTHIDQASRQSQLLADLAQSIAAFRIEMQHRGLWDRVLVLTHSEFGRSVLENSAHGTDHGKAGTHFVLGGRVKGRLIGTQSPLSAVATNAPGLHGLPFRTDFRQVYASVMQDWWHVPRTVSDAVISDDGAVAVSFGSLGLVG